MRSLLRLTLVLCGILSIGAEGEASELPDGTLLFLENCNSIVEYTTHGEVAHVALVFRDGGDAWVYEATPAKVRRVLVEDYFAELARLNRGRDGDEQIRVLALRPKTPYTAEETANMGSFLDTQLGRRYSVKNYVRGKPYDGIHCAELASTTLNHSGRYAFADCHKINPQALYAATLPAHAPKSITVPPLATQDPWLIRVQRRWIACFTWCRWSSREAWLFFW
jgi:hypothetical protein